MSKKSALLIGCNYLGTALSTDGCIADIVLFDHFLKERLYVMDTLLLCDVGTFVQPTKSNIRMYFENLISSAKPGDVLFFAYAGASQKLSKDAVIVPCDYIQNGYISSAEFKSMLDSVPEGVTLFCISDAPYSENPVSLRYEIKDHSKGELSLRHLGANGRKIPFFSKTFISKQETIENIPEAETEAAIIFVFGIGKEKTGDVLWSLIENIEKMHFYGIKMNHLLTRMQSLLKYNDIDTEVRMLTGQFLDLNVTFGRFVAGNL